MKDEEGILAASFGLPQRQTQYCGKESSSLSWQSFGNASTYQTIMLYTWN